MDAIKNIEEGSLGEIQVDEQIYVLRVRNDGQVTRTVERHIDRSYIQFHFCTKGDAKFNFNEGRYALQVREEHSLLLYNTQTDLPLNLELAPNTWVVSVLMSIRKFHGLFSQEADAIPFLETANTEKKYYAQENVAPVQAVVLSQLMNATVHPSVAPLYIKSKVYELIAIYFNRSSDVDMEQCPYLANEENVQKIRLAKEIILRRLFEPPTLKELSNEIGLPLKKLKEGFKQLYGDTVYGFLFDHKMEEARKLLESGRYNVNEVALKVGYSTASHFISAF
ncbi:MAG: helix-turn-helix transcriptional regulator, partial [Flavobacteriaceae bacterium]